MITYIDLINFGAAVGGLVVALLGLFLTISVQYFKKADKRFFVAFFSVLIVYVASDLTSQISLVFADWGTWQLSKAMIFSESLFSSMLMPMLTLHILRCAGENYKLSPPFYMVCSLWAVYAALLFITQFTDEIYFFTPDNVYHRGVLYPILLIPPALLMLINLFVLYIKRGALSHRQKTAFTIYLVLPLLYMIVQMFSYGLLMIVIGTSIAALFMFMFILVEQIDLYVKQREQIASQKANIAVLQMRLHFIHNTLTSIYFLCKKIPKKRSR